MTVNSKDIPLGENRVDYIGAEGGIKLFQLAPEKVIAEVMKRDPRIHYSPVREAWGQFVGARYENYRRDPLGSAKPTPMQQLAWSGWWTLDFARDRIRDIVKELGGNPLHIRGLATYLTEDSDVNSVQIKTWNNLFTPTSALNNGGEWQGMQTVATRVVGESKEELWAIQSVPFLFKHPQTIRKNLESRGLKVVAEKIYPMVIFLVEDKTVSNGKRAIRGEIFDYLGLEVSYVAGMTQFGDSLLK